MMTSFSMTSLSYVFLFVADVTCVFRLVVLNVLNVKFNVVF